MKLELDNKNIQLVISDIDGTILNEQHQIDKELIAALKALEEKSIPFILASARSPKGMYQIAEDLEITGQPLACYNGALILKNANKADYQPIFSHELAKNEVQQILEILQNEFSEITINLYAGQDWFIEKYNKWVEIEANITKETPIEADLKALIEMPNFVVHKFLLIGETADIEKVHAHFEQLKLATSAFYLSKENYLEVTHKEVSKEKALAEVADYFNIPLENILTMGDNFNDIPMLKMAGIGVAMENAPNEVQASADVITANNNEHGATKALQKYVLQHD